MRSDEHGDARPPRNGWARVVAGLDPVAVSTSEQSDKREREREREREHEETSDTKHSKAMGRGRRERRLAGKEASSIRGPRDGWVEVLNDFGIKTLMAFVSFPGLRELFRNS